MTKMTGKFYLNTLIIYILVSQINPWAEITSILVFVVFAYFYGRQLFGQAFVGSCFPTRPNVKLLVPLTIVTLMMYPLSLLLLNGSVFIFGNQMADVVASVGKSSLFQALILSALIPGISEEYFMRGLVLSGLTQMKRLDRLILVAFAFSMMHLNINQFGYTFFIGLIIGFVVLVTGNLTYGIYMHVINNAFGIVMERLLDLSSLGDHPFLIMSVLIGLTLISLYILYTTLNHMVRSIHQQSARSFLTDSEGEGLIVGLNSGIGYFGFVFLVVLSVQLFKS